MRLRLIAPRGVTWLCGEGGTIEIYGPTCGEAIVLYQSELFEICDALRLGYKEPSSTAMSEKTLEAFSRSPYPGERRLAQEVKRIKKQLQRERKWFKAYESQENVVEEAKKVHEWLYDIGKCECNDSGRYCDLGRALVNSGIKVKGGGL